MKVMIVTGKPYCDIPIGEECICLDSLKEIEERFRLGESLTVYWTNREGEHDAYYVDVLDIEPANKEDRRKFLTIIGKAMKKSLL